MAEGGETIAALQVLEARLAAMMSCDLFFVLIIDRTYTIADIRRAGTGYRREEIIGKSAYAYVRPENMDQTRAALERVFATGETIAFEGTGFGPHGEIAWYKTTLVPVKVNGEVETLVMFLTDTTAEHRLAMELEERRKTEQVLREQRETLLHLGAPIIRAWKGVLVLPVIGRVDEDRATKMTEKLLDEIVTTGSEFAILDLTGVAAMDATTTEHLLRIVRTARLLGSQCMLSGISPGVARMMSELAPSDEGFMYFSRLEDALRHAQRRGVTRT